MGDSTIGPNVLPESYLRGVEREMAQLGSMWASADQGPERPAAGSPGDGGALTAALTMLRAGIEARMARVVFNGDELRDAAADELERRLAWYRSGVTAFAADVAAASAEAPDRYWEAASGQLRAWQQAVDAVALDVYGALDVHGAPGVPGSSGGGDARWAELDRLREVLGGLRRRLRWGLGGGTWPAARVELDAGFGEVRDGWAALVVGAGPGGARHAHREGPRHVAG